jgi:hypothetical protein
VPYHQAKKFWLKNTFTVESYIFDKKQKEVYQTKQPQRDVRFDKVNPISKLCMLG